MDVAEHVCGVFIKVPSDRIWQAITDGYQTLVVADSLVWPSRPTSMTRVAYEARAIRRTEHVSAEPDDDSDLFVEARLAGSG